MLQGFNCVKMSKDSTALHSLRTHPHLIQPWLSKTGNIMVGNLPLQQYQKPYVLFLVGALNGGVSYLSCILIGL